MAASRQVTSKEDAREFLLKILLVFDDGGSLWNLILDMEMALERSRASFRRSTCRGGALDCFGRHFDSAALARSGPACPRELIQGFACLTRALAESLELIFSTAIQ
jgi:hypothetical protein